MERRLVPRVLYADDRPPPGERNVLGDEERQ